MTTAAPATTEAPAEVTTIAPTTTQPPPPEPAFIGDAVTLGSFGGPGIPGVNVWLFNDNNADGLAGRLIERTTTNTLGRYGFTAPAGCYVVRFSVVDQLEIDEASRNRAVCVEDGQNMGRIDAVYTQLPPPTTTTTAPPVVISRPPDGCLVEDGSERNAGVEVYEFNEDIADFYLFLGRNGGTVYQTPSEPDDFDNDDIAGDYEWFANRGGFDLESVFMVAASRNGVLSTPISCARE